MRLLERDAPHPFMSHATIQPSPETQSDYQTGVLRWVWGISRGPGIGIPVTN